MRHLFIFFLFLPFSGSTQTKVNSLSTLLSKDWQIMKAINMEDTSDVVYDRLTKVAKWGMEKTCVYRMNSKQLGLMNSEGNVDLGVADSITANRFIVHVTYPGGYKCVFEYSNIALVKNKLTYTFRKWNYITDTKDRLFHYGYHAICEPSKKATPKPTIAQIEKKRGNKISYVFTTVDGRPIADKEVKITIALNGMNMLTSVYTNSAGEATGYYPDSYFATNKHITLFIEYSGLKSSAVLEQKYCPAVLKRVLTTEDDSGNKISTQ